MATVTATRANTVTAPRAQEKGAFVDVSAYTTASTASGTQINLVQVKAGTTVFGIQMFNAALGGSSTCAIGDSVNGDNYWLGATSTASAATTWSTGLPYTFAVDATIYIKTGGATTTGVVGVNVLGTREAVVLA